MVDKLLKVVKKMYKGSGASSKNGMHRPEGAGNFDNMDDYNVVNSIDINTGTIQHNPTNNKDVVNKEYVDTEIDLDILTHKGDASAHHSKTTSGEIDHNATSNTHNLTTDIDHDQLTNFVENKHIDWTNATENLVTTGNITANQGLFSSPTFPVVDIVRDTLTVTGNVFAGAKLERIMTGGTAQSNSGLGFYFKSPNDIGTSIFSGIFGGRLAVVTDGTEIGEVIVAVSYHGEDPFLRTDFRVRATSLTTADSIFGETGDVMIGNTGTDGAIKGYKGSPYAQLTVENADSDHLKQKLFSRTASSGNVCGLGFGVHTSSSARIMKSSIFHERVGSWGQGDLIIAVDPNADQADVEVGDEVMRLKGDGSAELAKFRITAIGGQAIKLTNKTGSNSVAGQLVAPYSATAVDDAVATTGVNSDECIGITLDAGVSDGSEMWVVVSGIADVLMDAGGSGRGDRIITSATAGSADVWNVGGAVATHFQEIGHCIETRANAGLARCILHFN